MRSHSDALQFRFYLLRNKSLQWNPISQLGLLLVSTFYCLISLVFRTTLMAKQWFNLLQFLFVDGQGMWAKRERKR